MLNSPCQPMAVAAALPTCELCAQTTAFASPPRAASSRTRVSNMCRSRKIPRFPRTAVHEPIVLFRSPHHPRVLRGIEEEIAVAADIGEPPVEQRPQFREHSLFTGRSAEMERGATIAGGIVLPWGEAPKSSARRFGFLGVDPVEIGDTAAIELPRL